MGDVATERDARNRQRAQQVWRALEGAIVREDFQRIERALDEASRRRLGKAILSVREALGNYGGELGWQREARIDGVVTRGATVGIRTHELVGMWHPPAPPPSPQELDCTALVCDCTTELRDASQVRQHWERGCFDLPEYTTYPRPLRTWEETCEKLGAEEGEPPDDGS